MVDPERYRVRSGKLAIADFAPDDDGRISSEEGVEQFHRYHKRLLELQNLLAADGSRALLVVFQGMDTSGKDSATRKVFSGISPVNIDAVGFKAPSDEELGHDYLWRVHPHVPRRGRIGIFNRSHYEDVLVVRVKELVPESRWRPRYRHIREFERLLHEEGVVTLKFMLHISKAYQAKRLRKRLEDPEKHWKFNPDDLKERDHWDQYQEAYEEALAECSTDFAPWYVIPAEKRWFRDLLIVRIVVEALDSLGLRYPPLGFDPATVVIPK